MVFTDDDCAPATDWLTQIARQIKSTPDALIGGKSINAIPDNLFSETSQLLIDYLYDYFESANRRAIFTSNNLIVPANLFCKLGGFDSDFPAGCRGRSRVLRTLDSQRLAIGFICRMQNLSFSYFNVCGILATAL
ncbi:MAG: hypothetical protein R3C26_14915 [Calditrichia bacterium]